MNISIELYASLMKYLPPGKSRFKRELEIESGLTLTRLVEQLHIEPQQAHLVLVNGRHINLEDRDQHALQEDDVISIWPPVAGG